MPRTEPAPTWPLPTSWKIDFALGNRVSQRRNRWSGGTSLRTRQKGGEGASQTSPSRAASTHTSSTVVHPCAVANQAGTENEKSNPAITGGSIAATSAIASSRVAAGRLSTSVPSRTTAIQMPRGSRGARPVDRDNRGLGHAPQGTLRAWTAK